MKKIIACWFLILVFKNNYSQNVGIGTSSPAYKLDVAGRMRVKTGTLGNVGTTSGIWMEDYRDGTNRIFFGMQDSIRAGFYGSGAGGLGWQFNFNAKTGYVGMGRTASNYRLELDDVNGAGIGLFKNGSLGASISVTESAIEINPKNGSTACFPNPCPASDLILIPPINGMGTTTTGNVGIGLDDPADKLSLNGKMGLYNGNTFIGSLGRNGSDLLINAKNGMPLANLLPNDLILQTYADPDLSAGNVGIGSFSPTAKLEVNSSAHAIRSISNIGTGVFASSTTGTGVYATSTTGNAMEVNGKMKISGNGQTPAAGKILTSDASGMATWQGAIAFSVHSLNTSDGSLEIQPNTYVKVPFGFEEYDLSNNYNYTSQAPNHAFIAPVAGVYHFTTKVSFIGILDYPFMSLVLVRNGAASTIASCEKFGDDHKDNDFQLSRDVNLLVGDQVYVQVYHTSSSGRFLFATHRNMWFTGRLVIKL